MGYIDYHTHILPEIDDGARNKESSVRMIEIMQTQDIDCIVCTPHFYRLQEDVNTFLGRRETSYRTLQKALRDFGYTDDALPDMRLGAEVYMDQDLPYMNDLGKLAITGTNLLLLEMPFYGYRDWIAEVIYNVGARFNVRPVIAHLDRYIDLFTESDYENLFALRDVIFQINVDSFEYKDGIAFFLNLIKKGLPVIFGSDCHNSRHRVPNLKDNLELIEKPLRKLKVPKETVDNALKYVTRFPGIRYA